MGERIIGIDLGTTNSCVAVLEDNEPRVIPNPEGSRTTPSVFALSDNGEQFVGQLAKRQAITNPSKTVYAAKRLIGRKFEDPEVKELARFLPYEIVAADNGDAWIAIDDRRYSPSEIGAAILGMLKECAEDYVGETITRAVITVPAYFDDAQRQATKDAGRIAGLEVERIINEPTAATLAYGIGSAGEGGEIETRTVAVYDLGGGTFDISVLELREGAFEVLATSGDTFLGGEDFDNAIVDWAAASFKAEHGVELREDKLAKQRLKEAAEKAKHELSWSLDTELNLPFIAAVGGQPVHLELSLTRRKLEELTRALVERTLGPCQTALSDAELDPGDIDELLLVGGQTRMPLVQQLVGDFFGREPSTGVNPDEVVACGAAIQGGILEGEVKGVVLLDVAPLNIGVETAGGVFTALITKGTTIPTRKSEVFSTSVDNQPVVPVHVLQGLREMAEDNKSLARLQLTDIPPAPRGVPQIKVTFDISADGILAVSAQDLGTGKSASMTVQPTSGLTEDQLSGLAEEAEAKKSEDVARRELADLRNRAETLVYTCERSLEAFGASLSASARGDIEADLQVLKASLSAEQVDSLALREALAALETSSHQIYEAMLADDEGAAPE
ncbi:molecular chaperone DnaK [Pseudenhygromyxa sp. WMMC2535]|uniref:molecular chaperone DnaK n=1 Tax=Pseudenhygromyxa sp. WMMC2535 TaxID=2712867 RepID=UPI001554DCE1|nr:molecular chaperone DnaK [Pseudenhygromyxa sp. WMMC2535]NVB41184.1 molecular chaperone DnaK [Pseudenhygromyxa sp. WMMC2535]